MRRRSCVARTHPPSNGVEQPILIVKERERVIGRFEELHLNAGLAHRGREEIVELPGIVVRFLPVRRHVGRISDNRQIERRHHTRLPALVAYGWSRTSSRS